MVTDPIERLRAICLSLPEVTERLSHGEPTWFVRDKKVFVSLANQHHDDRVGFWAAAPAGEQEALIEADPTHFYRPPYVGHRGWIGVYLDVEVDWGHAREVIIESYRQVAPKTMVRQLDEQLAAENAWFAP